MSKSLSTIDAKGKSCFPFLLQWDSTLLPPACTLFTDRHKCYGSQGNTTWMGCGGVGKKERKDTSYSGSWKADSLVCQQGRGSRTWFQLLSARPRFWVEQPMQLHRAASQGEVSMSSPFFTPFPGCCHHCHHHLGCSLGIATMLCFPPPSLPPPRPSQAVRISTWFFSPHKPHVMAGCFF